MTSPTLSGQPEGAGDAFGPGSHASHEAGKPSPPSVSIPIAGHSSGTWEVVPLNLFGPFAIRMDYGDGGKFYGIRCIYREADAHLTAAAPELLERLQALSFEVKCFLGDAPAGTILRSAVEKADAAIARALHKGAAS